jgi:hypothetical protein
VKTADTNSVTNSVTGVARLVLVSPAGLAGRFVEAGGDCFVSPSAAFPRGCKALRRFGACQGSGAGFRRATRAINGLLTRSWCAVSSAVAAVFGKEAVCYE